MATRVIILDVDGLLFNTEEILFRELQKSLQLLDVKIDEVFYAHNKYDDCLYALNLSVKQKEEVLRSLRSRYYTDAILDQVEFKPGVPETLAALASQYKLAIGSGEEKEQIEKYLRHFGIRKYFSFIGHGTMVPGRKSNPAYFQTIAEYYDVPLSHCLHVGDTEIDQQALHAGVPVAIIPTKYSQHIAFDPRCHMLQSIRELPLLLKESSLTMHL